MLTGTFAADAGSAAAPDRDRQRGASAQPGAQTGTQWQVQAQLDRGPAQAGSPSAPSRAPPRRQLACRAPVPGRVQFVDNLSDSLNTAAGDALYAETLYLLLAVPGALIALGRRLPGGARRQRARPA